MDRTVLIIDDEDTLRRAIGEYLERSGYHVLRAATAAEGVELFTRERPGVVLLDLIMPDVTGFDLLQELVALDAAVIMLTGHAEIETAVAAIQHGAENFLTKPVELPHLVVAVEKVRETARLKRQVQMLQARTIQGDTGPSALGVSQPMIELGRHIEVLAANERTTVLISGETGTGKGFVARMIHNLSSRAHRPFVDINCGGLNATFVDSELFGHEPGAFTDAKVRKDGLFEIASGGTIFLDEIGDLALEVQPKLLKALEGKSFRRMGGTREIEVDTRLIAATNHDLAAAVQAGQFREDLYYRLSVVPVHLPPVRDRARDDLLALIERLTAEIGHDRKDAPREIESSAIDRLVAYTWPGNVREMRNVLERAVILAGQGAKITLAHLPAEIRGGRRAADGAHPPLSMAEVERRHIERTVRHHQGNRTRAAKDLGISRATLINKIKTYELDV